MRVLLCDSDACGMMMLSATVVMMGIVCRSLFVVGVDVWRPAAVIIVLCCVVLVVFGVGVLCGHWTDLSVWGWPFACLSAVP